MHHVTLFSRAPPSEQQHGNYIALTLETSGLFSLCRIITLYPRWQHRCTNHRPLVDVMAVSRDPWVNYVTWTVMAFYILCYYMVPLHWFSRVSLISSAVMSYERALSYFEDNHQRRMTLVSKQVKWINNDSTRILTRNKASIGHRYLSLSTCNVETLFERQDTCLERIIIIIIIIMVFCTESSGWSV